jgi:hypothetical protein
MNPSVPIFDAGYRKYAQLLLRRHQSFLEGRDEGPEIEEIEEDLSAAWEALNEVQRQNVNGMGSDLNWVRRHGAPPPRGRPISAVAEDDRQRLLDVEAKRDWHAVLHLLRVCAPILTIKELARRRAAAYAGLGLTDYADACRSLAVGVVHSVDFPKPYLVPAPDDSITTISTLKGFSPNEANLQTVTFTTGLLHA